MSTSRKLGLVLLAALPAGSGCSALPRSGPDASAIRAQATFAYPAARGPAAVATRTGYALFDLDERVVSALAEPREAAGSLGSLATFARGGGPSLTLGVGDVVAVTLFESSAGGLFVAAETVGRTGNSVTLPPQTVGPNGTISVPYAGAIRVGGRTPESAGRLIEARLADRAVEPQAMVQVVRSAAQVAVLGDVRAPTKAEINPAGERLLDVISRAGGLSVPAAEGAVTLQRAGRSGTVPFRRLVEHPAENVFVRPGDTVVVSRARRTFLAFGASGHNGRIDFEDADLSLADGVAKAGGLADARADPAAVFLYRTVADPKTLAALGLAPRGAAGVPVILRADLRDPSSFFLAGRLPLADRDVLYVSNAPSVELSKVLGILGQLTANATGPLLLAK